MSNKFESLHIAGWRQFGVLSLDLSARLTVLTGANAAGKTSVLGLLGRHFQWYQQFLALPERDEGGRLVFRSSIRRELRKLTEDEVDEFEELVEYGGPRPYGDEWRRNGTIRYSNGIEAPIFMQDSPSAITYDLLIDSQQDVPGLYMPSHRQMSGYQRVEWMPTSYTPSNQILEGYIQEIRSRYLGQTTSGKSNLTLMKEALLAAANFGKGSEVWTADPEAAEVWDGFQSVVALLVPESLGFEGLTIEPPDVIVKSSQGNFPIDAVSGGLSAIFEMAFQIFLRSRDFDDFTILLDEPENHLHPELQRSLMPRLLRAFPNVSFVIATHSPFIVTSSPEARVYVLSRQDGGVEARELDFVNKAASADETLRDVLGVTSTIPIWAEEEYNDLLSSFLSRRPSELTPELLMELRSELQSRGLGAYVPLALTRLADVVDINGAEK